MKDGENSEREKSRRKKSENKENAETNKYEGSNNGQVGQGKGDKKKEGMKNIDRLLLNEIVKVK